MPIRTTDNIATLKSIPEKYLIFYSSIVNGELWCPDCRAVDKLVKQAFGSQDSPSALLVYVGDRAEWKSSSNPYRAAPWNVTGVPTIIKLVDDVEDSRLVEDQIAGNLETLVRG